VALAVTLVGVQGAVVSGLDVVALAVSLAAEVLPEPSIATTW